MKRLLPILCFVLACSNFASHAQNLVANPSFESWGSGRPSSWNVSNTQNLSQNTTLVNAGTISCRVNATLNTFNLTQSVAVTPGKTYTFKISYYIESGDGTDARISCYFRNSGNTAIKMSLEDSLALKGPGGNTAHFPNVTGSWKTYTCDVVAPTGAANFYIVLSTSRSGTVSWDNVSLAVNSAPTVYSNNTAMTGFNYIPGNGPSAEQSFTIKGNNLTGSIVVNAPTNYEISATSGTSFVGTNSLTIAQTNGAVSTLPIYIRLKSGLAQNTYTGNVTISSTGATPLTISVTGTVAPLTPTITKSTTVLSGFTYSIGNGPSAQQSFTVSGTGLTSGIVVTAPTNYEISVLSGTSFIGTSSFTIAQSGGNVASTTIYVRLKPGLSLATYTGYLTLATAGATTQNIALSGSVTAASGITTSTTSLTGFSYTPGAGPSQQQSFTVSGTGLTTFIIITAPANFELSTESGTAFAGTSQLIIPQTNGSVPATTIYARMIAGLSTSTYSGNISASTSGYSTKTIAVNGNVSATTGTPQTQSELVNIFKNSGNSITVNGTIKDEIVSLYSITGQRLQTIKSQGERIEITVQPGAVYLIRTATKTLKVIL